MNRARWFAGVHGWRRSAEKTVRGSYQYERDLCAARDIFPAKASMMQAARQIEMQVGSNRHKNFKTSMHA